MSGIFDWSITPASNTTLDGINVNTGMSPANVDNAIRSLMALVRESFSSTLQTFLDGSAALPVANGGTGGTTAANARTALSAAKSGANTDITSLGGLTTALSIAQGGTGGTTAAAAIAALLSGAVTGGASAGTINLGVFKITWKDVTASANASTVVTYHSAFSSWSRAWCNGINTSNSAQDNGPQVLGGSETTTTCTVKSADDAALACTVFAIGV